MSWAEVDRVDPVSSDAGEFERLARGWRTAADTARSLSMTFDGIVRDTGTIGFEGQSADAFQQIVEENSKVLADVPAVCGDLASLLARHASELSRLRASADAALARARAAWGDRYASETAANRAHGRAERVRRQIRSLQGYPPEQVAPQMQTLRYNLSVEERSAANHEYDAVTAGQRLLREYTNRDSYETTADSLDRATAEAIRRLDLRSLKDPNAVMQFLLDPGGAIGQWLSESAVGRWLAENGEALLWALRDALETVSTILSVAIVVLAAVSLVFPPAGAVLGVLVTCATVVAVAKAATSGILFLSRSSEPGTGRQIGALDFGMDVFGAVTAVAGANAFAGPAGRLMASASKTGLLPEMTAVMKVVIVPRLTKSLVGDVATDASVGIVNNIGQAAFGDGAASRSIFGSDGDHPTPQASCVRRQTSAIENRDRGLSAPCRPVVVPCAVGGAR